MELLSQFNLTIKYLKGKDNSVADALSRPRMTVCSPEAMNHRLFVDEDDLDTVCVLLPSKSSAKAACKGLISGCIQEVNASTCVVAVTLAVSPDAGLLVAIKSGYKTDEWCKRLAVAAAGMQGVECRDGLWFIGDRLVVPRVNSVREYLYQLAHNALGHFGFDKLYSSLRDSYYWPNMRRDLENSYLKSCVDCMKNKDRMTKKAGPLHPLPVPDGRFKHVAIDFVGPLPKEGGFNELATFTDRLGADIRLAPVKLTMNADQFAVVFFNTWYCENGLPETLVSDRDKLLTSRFWKALTTLTGVKLEMSSAHHPETDGASEKTNKTVVQCVRFHVDNRQKGWVAALPKIRFDIMNTLIAPLVVNEALQSDDRYTVDAAKLIKHLELDVLEAQDSLWKAKIDQAASANAHRAKETVYKVGDWVGLCSTKWRREFKDKSGKTCMKFMARFDGPYKIIDTHPETSNYTLDMPNHPNVFPVFHGSELKALKDNDDILFPNRVGGKSTTMTEDGEQEFFIDHIVECKQTRNKWRYLVRWIGWGPENDSWLQEEDLVNSDVWKEWWRKNSDDKRSSEGGRV